MTLAQAAQRAIELGGTYDGHELPKDINKLTVASATALAGQGLMAVAKDKYPHDGSDPFLRRHVCRSRSRCRNRQVSHSGFPRLRRRRHGDPSAELWAARFSADRSWASATRSARSGSTTSITACRWPSASTTPSRRRFSTCRTRWQWAAFEIPDPETPVGARGIGEPPVGGGCCAILNALSDALGDEIFRRAPVTADIILASLEAGRPMQDR